MDRETPQQTHNHAPKIKSRQNAQKPPSCGHASLLLHLAFSTYRIGSQIPRTSRKVFASGPRTTGAQHRGACTLLATIPFLRPRVCTRVHACDAGARAFFFVACFSEYQFGRRVLKSPINTRENAVFSTEPGRYGFGPDYVHRQHDKASAVRGPFLLAKPPFMRAPAR